MPADITDETLPSSGQHVLVHKTDYEGAIVIDALSGHVIVGQQDKPEWAAGYLLANLAERHNFYTTRLGPDYTEAMKAPEAFNADDLSWVAWDNEQKEVEVPASAQFRSEVIREVIRSKGLITTDAEGVDHWNPEAVEGGVMLDPDNRRTAEELSALKAAQESGFQAVQEAERRTGTGG